MNGTTLTFVASGATGNQINIGDSIQSLLGKIDQITGSSKPSTIHGGVITINTDDPASLNISSSNTTALGSLGFSSSPVTASNAALACRQLARELGHHAGERLRHHRQMVHRQ